MARILSWILLSNRKLQDVQRQADSAVSAAQRQGKDYVSVFFVKDYLGKYYFMFFSLVLFSSLQLQGGAKQKSSWQDLWLIFPFFYGPSSTSFWQISILWDSLSKKFQNWSLTYREPTHTKMTLRCSVTQEVPLEEGLMADVEKILTTIRFGRQIGQMVV